MSTLRGCFRLVIELRKKDLDNSDIGIKTVSGSSGSSGDGLGDILGFVNKIDASLNMVSNILNKVEGLKNKLANQTPMQQTTPLRPAIREVAIKPEQYAEVAPEPKKKEEPKQEENQNPELEGLEVEDMTKIKLNADGFLDFVEGLLEQVGTKEEMTIKEVKDKFKNPVVKSLIKGYLKDNQKLVLDSLMMVQE